MISEEKMDVLNQQFQRIFTLPVTRLTFRELQMALSTALNNDAKSIQSVTEQLLSNEFTSDSNLEEFFKEYSVPFRVAKQIQDNGEVLSMLSTDIGTQGDNLLFQVRIRRIDGGEYTFITDAGGFLQVAEHIVQRLGSTKGTLAGRGAITNLEGRLQTLQKSIGQLLEN